MYIEYPTDKFDKVKSELKEYWNSIDKEYIFWTPSTSNIFGYTLSNWYDVRFPHTCELLTHIKKTNLVTNIVLYVYTPHTRTTFHTDKVSFRYVYPIVSNEMCFNYEIKTNTSQFEMDTKLFDINTIDKLNNFNTEFVNSGNVISNWEENNCYLIGSNIHAHLNYSDTNRIALVIDTKENLI
jgi:hypothetical protein